MFNAASYFVDRHIVEGRGSAVAIECGDGRVTYADLHEQVGRTASAMRDELGIRPEERVLLLMLDGPELAFAFFGAIKIGAVPIPANTLWTPDDYEFLLHDSRAVAVIVSAPLHARIAEVLPRCRSVRHVVVAGGPAADGAIDFDALIARGQAETTAEETSEDAPAFWLYSSGSTGRPKACVHLQHDMRVCAETYARSVLEITSRDRCFSVAKLFFAYGLGNGLYFPLAVGATAILWPGRPRRQLCTTRSSGTVPRCSSPFRRTTR